MFMLGLVGVMVILFVSALLVTSAVLASHTARSAADLAALAGAQAPAPSCAEATRVAAANGARIEECRAEGAFVDVAVAVTPSGAAAGWGEARARARAGPENSSGLGAPPRGTPRDTPGPRSS